MDHELTEALAQTATEDFVLRSDHYLVYRAGAWEGPYRDEDLVRHSRELLKRISENAGLELSLTQPSADAFLDWPGYGFFRAHAVVAPMSTWAFEITLRRLRPAKSFGLPAFGASPSLAEHLGESVLRGANLLIAGATGSGKSSLLFSLLSLLPERTRVLILEDSPELDVPNVVSSKLLARNNRYGHRLGAQWSLADLVFESLRMRPDRLVLGECRGPEASAVAQALQTGHRGVMTTIHAGSGAEALARFAALSGNPSPRLWDGVLHLRAENGQKIIAEYRCPTHNRTWNFSSCAFAPDIPTSPPAGTSS